MIHQNSDHHTLKVATPRGLESLALNGFSEDLNMDGFVDPVAQAVPAPLTFAAPALAPVAAPAVAPGKLSLSCHTSCHSCHTSCCCGRRPRCDCPQRSARRCPHLPLRR